MAQLKNEYTIVIVTHNMQQAARVADRTAFFSVELRDDGGANRHPRRVRRHDEDLHESRRQADGGLRDWTVRMTTRRSPPGGDALPRRLEFHEELDQLEATIQEMGDLCSARSAAR